MHFKKLITLISLILIILGCSTKKNTLVSRAYHNLTAHYNVYFNGNESFKSGARKVEAVNKDDYTQLLPVFPSSKKENLDGASGEMDVAIDKGGKLITKHSITVKPSNANYARKNKGRKEYNNWVDDGYLLVAKAQFYKKEYSNCINTCNTIIRDYPETASKHEAYIWMSRALIETKQYADAQSTLEGYDISTGAPRSLLSFYYATSADLNIRKEQYAEAIPYMKGAYEKTTNKKRRIRYQYILAQLYHKTNNLPEAASAYENVIKMNPSYEISLNAKVKRGSILLANASPDEIKNQLNRLLKSKKNIDFRGRIYYALAQVSLSEKDEKQALLYFRKSIDASADNPTQKNVSFLAIGDLSYSKEDYKSAYMNYDSAFTSLDKESNEYTTISKRHASLKNLVTQIDIVSFEDSVQTLAKLTTTEQEAYVDRMILQKKQHAAELAKIRDEAKGNGFQSEFDNPYNSNSQNSDLSPNGVGKWYFYNPGIITQGKSEFARKWGNRKLEDNWRRSNKEAVVAETAFEQFPGDPDSNPARTTPPGGGGGKEKADSISTKKDALSTDKILTKTEYLKDIPNTPEQIAASNILIEKGLSEMSRVYANQLFNFPRTIKTLEELNRRFPKSNERLGYLIALYQAHISSSDQTSADKVKEVILREYPNSEFAMYLTDPEYFNKLNKRKKEIDSIYEICYTAYLSNDFNTSITSAQAMLSANPKNHLADKFTFLIALSNAKSGNSEKFKTNLTTIVAEYPKSECAPLSKEFLAQIEAGKTPIREVNISPKLDSSTDTLQNQSVVNDILYDFPDSTAMLVVVVTNGNADKNRLIYNVADYNFNRFIINDFELSTIMWKDKSILKVEPFNNTNEAMDYFYAIRENDNLFKVENSGSAVLLVISKSNLVKLTTSGDLESYKSFFKRNYLQRKE